MPKPLWIACRMDRRSAFTLVELLVAMAVLVLLISMIAQMTSGVSSIVSQGDAHIDTDMQARALLDRMAIDFGAMVKRPDVDYYLKGRPTTLTQKGDDPTRNDPTGNDQIAFYTEVPGYFPTSAGTTAQSSTSLVAYRVNTATMHLERLCKGLAWNGAAAASAYTMAFFPVPLASPLPSPLPSPTPATFPAPLCPLAADPTTADLDYEEMGPQVFRFEYYYVLKGQTVTPPATPPPTLSLTPWNVTIPNHTSVNGMQDVAGIGVVIAVIDSKSRTLVTNAQLANLASQMEDAPDPNNSDPLASATPDPDNGYFTTPGHLENQWMSKVNSSKLPRTAMAAVRVYTRCFYLNGVSP